MTADLPPEALRLQVDGRALTENWRALDRMSGLARTGAAVKANAYGVGVREVVPVLLDAGARDFFVAHWSEVPDLLAANVPAECISVLHGVRSAAEAGFARQAGVRPVINSLPQARLWSESGGGACHLMVDTGINRLGIQVGQLTDPLIAALDVEVLMSHLACADEESDLNGRQLAQFQAIAAQRPDCTVSLANSAGIALGKEYGFGLTRPGLALYGGVPRPELASRIRQAVFPQAAILQTRELQAGDTVGYNARFTARQAMRVATVSIGYADGFLRCRGGGAALQHGAARFPVLGRVSMDMVVVDLAAEPALREGDFLDIPFDLPTESERSGLSQYELLTSIGHRFRRTLV